MQRKLGGFLAFVGAFLLVVGVLAQFYATDSLKKTPLDVDSVTHLAGTAQLNGPDGVDEFPVKVTSTTKSDTEKSDDDVIVFKNSSCVVKDEGDVGDCVSSDDPQNRLLTASVDDFATDRVTALAVNDAKYLPSAATPHEGLINKWPFDAEKKTYPYWSGTVGAAVDAKFDRTEELEGVETYVYSVTIEDAPIEVADGVDGLYSDQIEIWIEPRTGSIVNQTSQQQRTLTNGDPVLALDVAFTDAQVKEDVEEADSSGSRLGLITSVVPLVGYLVGIPLLVVGIALMVLGRRKGEPSRHVDHKKDKTPVSS